MRFISFHWRGNITRTIFGIGLAAILGVFGLIHIYWAAGGSAGRSQAVPEVDGDRAFEPSTSATLMVAAGLFAAMLVSLGAIGWFGDFIPPLTYAWPTLVIALLFLLRAIGDFRLVGFFKKHTGTSFAYWDTRLYSPLCLLVTLLASVVLWLRP